MAPPVWVLSVDLQTKTATFQSGMGDAARSAKDAFKDIKTGASDMATETGGSMSEARHGVMLLGEEFGVHLPRGITMFLSSLGPVAAVMEAAFPFLAILVGATLLLEHLAKLREAGDKVASEWGHIDTEATKALSKTADELLTVQMEADKLAGNYLGALQKQLTLIDHQSLSELESAFDGLASKMDAVFKLSERGTLMQALLGPGATDEVKAQFDKFKDQYDGLLSQGKDSEARGALVDEIIQAQAQLKKYQQMGRDTADAPLAVNAQTEAYGRLIAKLETVNRLQDMNSAIGSQKKKNATTEAQDAHPDSFNPELFVDAENKKRVSIADTIAAVKKEQEATNAAAKLELEGMEGLSKGLKEIADQRDKMAQDAGKEDAGHELRMAQLELEANREGANMKLAQGRMSAVEFMDMEMSFNAQELAMKKAALNAEIASLDQHDKEYENKKRALNNKLLELDKQFYNQDQALENAAEQKRFAMVQSWINKTDSAYAEGFSKVIMGKESFAKAMQQADAQIAGEALKTALTNLMQLETVQGRKRLSDARTSAADAYASAGNPILGAILAGVAFAEVMAFESGGIVPGTGIGDTVPARLEPGEAVIPKQMTEMLSHAAKFGNNSGGQEVHVHHSPTYHINAIDGASVRGMLNNHADEFKQHYKSTLRKMNK